MLVCYDPLSVFSRSSLVKVASTRVQAYKRPNKVQIVKKSVSRLLATHAEPPLEDEVAAGIYDAPIPMSGYTSRHVISIFPPLPVLDKLQEMQAKLSARTRMVPLPRTSFQVVLVPLGTSLEEPGKMEKVKEIMDRVARQTQPIKLEIGGIGCLPKWSKPREVFAGLTLGREQVKSMIKVLETELAEARFSINEPGAVRHRTRVPLGVWEDVYVTNLQGDLAKEVADSVGQYTQASFDATRIVLLEQKPDVDVVPLHVSLLGGNLPAKKRARYKTLL